MKLLKIKNNKIKILLGGFDSCIRTLEMKPVRVIIKSVDTGDDHIKVIYQDKEIVEYDAYDFGSKFDCTTEEEDYYYNWDELIKELGKPDTKELDKYISSMKEKISNVNKIIEKLSKEDPNKRLPRPQYFSPFSMFGGYRYMPELDEDLRFQHTVAIEIEELKSTIKEYQTKLDLATEEM